jgi:hypothetical protein
MASATKTGQAVAPVEEKPNAVIPADFLSEIEADAGSGVQMGMADAAVPYLYILQTNSPQVNEDHALYVKGAKAGMFYNNVSGEVFDGREQGVVVIPCGYERKYVEWVPRDNGGGYVADHDVNGPIMSETKPDERGRPILANGNLIVETTYHYVYMRHPEEGNWERIIVPMKSTALKKSRRWNTALMSTLIPGTQKQAPRWLFPYLLKTVKEQKDQNTWSNFDITRLPDIVSPEQYRQCKMFAEQMAKGEVVRGKEAEVDTTVNASGGTSGGTIKKAAEDDDIPF